MYDPPRRAPHRDRRYSSMAWRRVREQVRERDRHACQACGRREPIAGRARFPVDHRDPRGRFTDPANRWLLCWSCNTSKGGMTVEEWYQSAGRQHPAQAASLAIRGVPGSGRPSVDNTKRFLAWVLELPSALEEPADHHHRRWSTSGVAYTRQGTYQYCPASCERAPVRWPYRGAA